MTIRHPNLGTVLRGIGVSPGIVMGNATRIDATEIQVEHIHLPETLLDGEIKRLHEAVTRAATVIDRLEIDLAKANHADAVVEEMGEHMAVLDAHKLMLHDPMLLGEAERLIRAQGIG